MSSSVLSFLHVFNELGIIIIIPHFTDGEMRHGSFF